MALNRRRLLRLGSFAAGLATTSFWVESQHGQAMDDLACTSDFPASGNPPVYTPVESSVQIRRSAASLWQDTNARATLLAAAAAFKGPNDAQPSKEWLAQANVHCLGCSSGFGTQPDVHNGGHFLPWHRVFLYFFERALRRQKPGGEDCDSLRLPYWDWENPASATIPQLFQTGALNHGNRHFKGLLTPAEVDVSAVFKCGDQDIRFLMGVNEIGVPSQGPFVSGAHGAVHQSFVNAHQRGDMSDFDTAALDPIFFAHHCNVDRLWDTWMTQHPGAKANLKPGDIPQPLFVRDAVDGWFQMTLDCLWNTTTLGYRYENPVTLPAVLTSLDTVKKTELAEFADIHKAAIPSDARNGYLLLTRIDVTKMPPEANRFGILSVKAGRGKAVGGSLVGRFYRVPSGGHHRHPTNLISAAISCLTPLPSLKGGANIGLHLAALDNEGRTLNATQPLIAAEIKFVA